MGNISQEANLILQSYFTVALISALSKDKQLLKSEFYKTLNLEPSIRDGIDQIGVDNQGCALMALYAMLVIPKELLRDRYKTDYDTINTWLSTILIDVHTTYVKSPADYIRHIRNAIAHAKVTFEPSSTIKFEDEDKRNNFTFEAKLQLNSLGLLLEKLQAIHIRYVQDSHAVV